MKKVTSVMLYPFKKLFSFLGGIIYDLKVKLFKNRKQRSISLSSQKKLDLLFYIGFMILPVIMLIFGQFIINGNSILLAFKKYNPETLKAEWAGIDNFKQIIYDIGNTETFSIAIKNSLTVFFSISLITLVLPIFISYYIYKKFPGHKVFKTILFLPTIISSVITISIFKTITEEMIPELMRVLFNKEQEGLLSNTATTYGTIFFYSLFMSFGGGLLINLSAMSTVDESVSEAAELDGVGFFGELWHVVLPVSYQILSLNFIMSMSTFFTLDLNMYAFYGSDADIKFYTIGYYFTTSNLKASNFEYPYLAAWGLLESLIAIPVTLTLRHLIYKYGPTEDSK